MAKKGNLSINSDNIFPVIKKWLYSDHDIFVREMISNGCDAITKLKKLDMIGEYSYPDDFENKIRVVVNPEEKTMVRDKFEEGNQKILSEYVHDGERLFSDPKEKPVWDKDNPDLYEDTVLMLGYMILEQEKEIDRLKKTLYLRLKLYDKCRDLLTRAVHTVTGSPE